MVSLKRRITQVLSIKKLSLQQVLAQFTADTSAKAMVDTLIDDATTFGANMTTEEEDDITVVVVKVL